ncbi:hypothetical protein [Caulobacter sp. Root343]|uniref:hypothetical protein n=1 Tax=Caulobacter sp. Root343 TaxID=1736520 RepID=UPI0006F2C7C3|nr:hypothetical protein [Caulobacter sp. Root343]KQV66593.1 hypothetical protein ASC70_12225 [Caulobacter sp. Root343]
MVDRPILFSGPMVRAIQSDIKGQTRRVMKPAPGKQSAWLTPEKLQRAPTATMAVNPADSRVGAQLEHPKGGPLTWVKCPYGNVGDRLWVREELRRSTIGHWVYGADEQAISMRHTDPRAKEMVAWAHHKEGNRCPPMHMPHWASRLTLEITGLRVERLRAITEADAEAEGVREASLGDPHVISPDYVGPLPRVTAPALVLWEFLWRSINGDESWDANPWVWVVEFKRVQP